MYILRINSILKVCQILSSGRKYTCPMNIMDGKLMFRFKKQWHNIDLYTSENTTELYEEDGKVFSRKFN